MQLATDAVIEYFRYLFSRFGWEHFLTVHCHPYLYRKEGAGVTISEDMFGVLSPVQLEEFLIPYLNQISSELGAMVLHSCGDCNRKFGLLNKIRGLVGIHFGQTDISQVFSKDIPRLCLLSPSDWTSREQISDFVQTLKENSLRGWVQVHTIAGEIEQKANNVNAKHWLDLANHLKYLCESKYRKEAIYEKQDKKPH